MDLTDNVIEEVQQKEGLITSFLDTLPEKALNLGIRIGLALIFFFIGVQLIKLIRKIIRKSMNRAGAEMGVIQFVDSFVKASLYIILILTLASSFGVDAASIVALLGSAGVAVGLAVQGSLSNLAGGVLILLLKPFKVGDYIVEGSSGKEGTVKEIQIFYTKLLTYDNQTIILPNGNLANNTIVNVTAAESRRCDVKVSVAYSADIKKAKEVLTKVLSEDPDTIKEREHFVFVDELADSGINLCVRCWFKNEDFWQGKWRITEQCKYALDEAEEMLLVVANFSGVPREITTGVPYEGKYKEILNTDAVCYGGTGVVNDRMKRAEDLEWDDKKQSVTVKLAPLSLSILQFIPYTEAELEKVIEKRIRKNTPIRKTTNKTAKKKQEK